MRTFFRIDRVNYFFLNGIPIMEEFCYNRQSLVLFSWREFQSLNWMVKIYCFLKLILTKVVLPIGNIFFAKCLFQLSSNQPLSWPKDFLAQLGNTLTKYPNQEMSVGVFKFGLNSCVLRIQSLAKTFDGPIQKILIY